MTIGAGDRGPGEQEEIAEFGRGRTPRRSPWLIRLLLGALLLATVGVAIGRYGTQPQTPPRQASPPPLRLHQTVTRLGPGLLGITAAWDIFARGPNDLVEIQPARGLITTTVVPALETGLPEVSFIIGAHEVLVSYPDLVPGYLIRDGAAPLTVTGPFRNGGPVIPGPDRGHVWVLPGSVGNSELELVGLDGRLAGRSLLLRAGQDLAGTAVSDGRGYVLLMGEDSRLYDVGPGFSRPVAGQVVAVGPTAWLAVSCHAQRCRNLVVNPATGADRLLPGAAAQELYWDWPPRGVVSPDGSTAAVIAEASTPSVRLINMRSGTSRTLPVPMANSPANQVMVWSPDSRWLFLAASNGRLLALNARTGALQTFGGQLPNITQVAIRPASDSASGTRTSSDPGRTALVSELPGPIISPSPLVR
ncbi:MAG TPA: hypothetical protein VGI58_21825 [Streptosporangiaceae bacterium]